MPRVRVSVPDELLQAVATVAEKRGLSVDELYVEAVAYYVKTRGDVSPGAVRSRFGIPHGSPTITVDLPEDLYQSSKLLAKRLGKRREILYSEAVALAVAHAPETNSAIDQGHDLPLGAWRPGDPDS